MLKIRVQCVLYSVQHGKVLGDKMRLFKLCDKLNHHCLIILLLLYGIDSQGLLKWLFPHWKDPPKIEAKTPKFKYKGNRSAF